MQTFINAPAEVWREGEDITPTPEFKEQWALRDGVKLRVEHNVLYLITPAGYRLKLETAHSDCPFCGEPVFPLLQEVSWVCPCDLDERNPYWELGDEQITEALREQTGVYSNCGEDYGFPCHERLPFHIWCDDLYWAMRAVQAAEEASKP